MRCAAVACLLAAGLAAAGLAAAGLAAAGLAAGQAVTTAERPNVVLILADDLGYGDLGVYGSRRIRTPHLDALAASGTRFTAAYVAAAVCSPSRAGLITGRYPARFGYDFNDNHVPGLPAKEQTLGERLQDAGYATGYVGKWHLGWAPEQRPQRRGFGEFFGMEDSGSLYIDPETPGVESWAPNGALPRQREKPVYRGDRPVEEAAYLTDAWTREALAFIDRHHQQDDPFFLFIAYNAPHTPLQATAEYLEPYRHLEDPASRIFAAMVSALDSGVGAIRQRLQHHGLQRDTLVVFLSDNGCANYNGPACSNAPLSGGKRSHQEGGVRVPFLLSWPAMLPEGRVYDEPVSALDLVPTLVAAAGAPAPADTDGVDLTPFLRGERPGPPHRRLFWRAGRNRAVLEGSTKLWQVMRTTEAVFESWASRRPPPGWPRGLEALDMMTLLYDLDGDASEQHDLRDDRPDSVRRLVGALDDWERGMVAPTVPARRGSAIRVDGAPAQLVF